MSAKLNTITRLMAWLLAGLFTVGLAAAPVLAQSGPGSVQQLRAFLTQRDRDIKQSIRPVINKTATAAQRKTVENLINDPIDFEEMGRRAIGPFWKDLTSQQRTEFVNLFELIVRTQSMADLEIYNTAVTYDQVEAVGDSAYVKTRTTYQDKQATVEYYLGWHDGSWWLYDIVLDDVSTVEGYARSFQSVLRKKGFDSLMRSLHKKREKLEAKNKS